MNFFEMNNNNQAIAPNNPQIENKKSSSQRIQAPSNVNMQMEEEKGKLDPFEKSMNTGFCQACKKFFTDEEERNELKIMLIETECFHCIHKACFARVVNE